MIMDEPISKKRGEGEGKGRIIQRVLRVSSFLEIVQYVRERTEKSRIQKGRAWAKQVTKNKSWSVRFYSNGVCFQERFSVLGGGNRVPKRVA